MIVGICAFVFSRSCFWRVVFDGVCVGLPLRMSSSPRSGSDGHFLFEGEVC
jgi:hypothetical protein